jgi:hypothetical protein
MPTGVHTQTDVPPDQVDVVVAGYEAQGASVVKKLQADGNYTVIATFPDRPAATKPARGKPRARR